MTALTFSTGQMQALARGVARRRLGALGRQVDAALGDSLPDAPPNAPAARLRALCEVTMAPLAGRPEAALLRVDVAQAAGMLQRALDAGATYREPHAAAMLAAAAALGALWFIDDRLLRGGTALQLTHGGDGNGDAQGGAGGADTTTDRSIDASAWRQLFSPDMAERFDAASRRARRLQAPLRHAWRAAADAAWAPAAIHCLADAAWDDGSDAGWLPRFVASEQRLLAAAGITDAASRALCLAGDLALGLGRSVRWLASAGATSGQIEGVLHELV